jgi:hypothetical protein
LTDKAEHARFDLFLFAKEIDSGFPAIREGSNPGYKQNPLIG